MALKFYLILIGKSVLTLVVEKLAESEIYSSLIINIDHVSCIIYMVYT